jgi:hypothetical protein
MEYMNLEQEQIELLSTLVEAFRNTPKPDREPFLMLFLDNDRNATIQHKSFGKSSIKAYPNDVWELQRQGLIAVETISRGAVYEFDITTPGFSTYREAKQKQAEPLKRVEDGANEYLKSERFQNRYLGAFKKWLAAEELLWVSESDEQLTTVGHLCREAMQEFATLLVERYRPPDVNQNKSNDVSRIRAVLQHKSVHLGDTEKSFLDALIPYWGTVSDLVQRQEHGGQKEGRPLVWDDARRVLFQTANVMFEVDKALSRFD